jgi:hypothetical protein
MNFTLDEFAASEVSVFGSCFSFLFEVLCIYFIAQCHISSDTVRAINGQFVASSS